LEFLPQFENGLKSPDEEFGAEEQTDKASCVIKMEQSWSYKTFKKHVFNI
jgi:hypothetical protein